MEIHVGTSGFAHKEWQGKFYPEKISPKEMLRFYAGRLDTVEINNTFYHMPQKKVLASWADQVPPDFVFSLKAPQVMTHIRRLRNIDEETAYFFSALATLGPRLGSVLFQFPKSFRADIPSLRNFLEQVPAGAAAAFEFRSPTWLEAGAADLLREKGMSLCIADSDEAPATDIIATAKWGYLRLRRSDYAEADLSAWRDRIRAQGWDRAFVYFKHEGEAGGAELALRFRKLLAGEEGLKKAV